MARQELGNGRADAGTEVVTDQRTGAVDTHRNGLSVAKAFGAWCVKRGCVRANPFATSSDAGGGAKASASSAPMSHVR